MFLELKLPSSYTTSYTAMRNLLMGAESSKVDDIG